MRDWDMENQAHQEWVVAKEMLIKEAKAAVVGMFDTRHIALREAIKVEEITRERFRTLVELGLEAQWLNSHSVTTQSFSKRLRVYLGSEFMVLREWLQAVLTP